MTNINVKRIGYLAVGLALLMGIHSVDGRAQPDDIVIDTATGQRSGVAFPHTLHMDTYECLDCHHDYQDGINVLDEGDLAEDGSAACGACHYKGAKIQLKQAYHRQCMGCHRTLNQQDDGALPITCRDCHPKGLAQK